jgi:hypothetical protein
MSIYVIMRVEAPIRITVAGSIASRMRLDNMRRPTARMEQRDSYWTLALCLDRLVHAIMPNAEG